MQRKWQFPLAIAALATFAPTVSVSGADQVRTVRFVQDDAQDYMTSKVYELHHLMANDVAPFLLGIVKRYNINSSVNRINYKAAQKQLLTVTCPVGMMPYVDEFIKAVDRPSGVVGAQTGDPLRGTGITNDVYNPQYRSCQQMVDILYKLGVNSGKYDSLIGYDENSNQIYWKDGAYKSTEILKYLGWLDRPAPEVTITIEVLEVRDSTLRDLGIDYLGWKNGPGLNIFQAGFNSWGLSSAGSAALQATSGAFGGFFFAPQFDASFVRVLQQDGLAKVVNAATLTVTNSDSGSYSVEFDPESQNLYKSDNDRSSVGISAVADMKPLSMTVTAPVVCLSGPADAKTGQLGITLEDYAHQTGVLVFTYAVDTANVVERNNYGAELIETGEFSGSVSMRLGVEKLLGSWEKDSEVEQTIGVPWLSDIPVLKYFFSTTTTSKEKSHVFITATASLVHPSQNQAPAGCLIGLNEVK